MNNDEQTKLNEILETLKELKDRESKLKDKWDKAGIIGQLISGVVLTFFGLLITWSIANSQKNAQQLSLDATDRQTVARYLESFDRGQPSKLATLLQGADAALAPKYSVPLAVRFTQWLPVEADIRQGELKNRDDFEQKVRENEIVNEAAIALLQRLNFKAPEAREAMELNFKAPEAREAMKQIANSGYPPDKAIADFILEDSSTVLFRVSNIDDFVDVYVNGERFDTYEYGSNPGWIDVTEKLRGREDNSLTVIVKNNRYGGTKVRVEVQAGAEQYNLMIRRHDVTDEGVVAFLIGFNLSVDTKGLFHLNGYEVPDM